MTFDPGRLMAMPIPEVVQDYGPRACALYALSLGLGQDPMDPAQLRYTGGCPVVVPFATMPVVLGHPGFWLADPRCGVDPARVVHGEQGLTLHAPLPPQGRVIGRTRVIAVTDKGPGRGVLIHQEKDVVDAGSGVLLATSRNVTFVRGAGGCGSRGIPPDTALPAPADGPPACAYRSQTRPEQALLYRWNGDDNPLHLDPSMAARAGFSRPILHGLCTFGMAAAALVQMLAAGDAGRLRAIDCRFTAPVLPGDVLVTQMWHSGAFRVRVPDRDVTVLDHGHFRMDGLP